MGLQARLVDNRWYSANLCADIEPKFIAIGCDESWQPLFWSCLFNIIWWCRNDDLIGKTVDLLRAKKYFKNLVDEFSSASKASWASLSSSEVSLMNHLSLPLGGWIKMNVCVWGRWRHHYHLVCYDKGKSLIQSFSSISRYPITQLKAKS